MWRFGRVYVLDADKTQSYQGFWALRNCVNDRYAGLDTQYLHESEPYPCRGRSVSILRDLWRLIMQADVIDKQH